MFLEPVKNSQKYLAIVLGVNKKHTRTHPSDLELFTFPIKEFMTTKVL